MHRCKTSAKVKGKCRVYQLSHIHCVQIKTATF